MAIQDPGDIWAYIAKDSPEVASRVMVEIRNSMNRLASRPAIGHLRGDLVAKPVRFWLVRSYLLAYLPTTMPIQILRILSRFRDLEEILKD